MQHACYSARFVLVLAALSASILVACSGDDGKPLTGAGTGTGTGDGTGGGKSTASGDDTSKEPTTTQSSTEPAADAGAGGDAAATATKKLKAAEGPCDSGDDCESGVCFVGGTQAYCSAKCTPETAATACAAPFTGSCNKQGYCKRD